MDVELLHLIAILSSNLTGGDMKQFIAISLFALCTACSSTGDVAKTSASETAHKQHLGRTLPVEEKAFVLAIEQLDKQAIIKDLGEPAKADDVKVKGTNKVVASIWHYHNINIDESGQHYETTELDFIDDKVVQVVFLNNDGSESEPSEGEIKDKQHAYEIPENKPSK